MIHHAASVIVAAVVILVAELSFKPQKRFICELALILESSNGGIMGGRQAGERSHTKAACLSEGSGCLAVSGPGDGAGVSLKTELRGD